jgi:F-box and WD-40 domain protein 1/11
MERNSEPQSRIPHLLRLQASNYQSGCVTPSLAASFKLDEGYADETRSQPDNETNLPLAGAMTLPEWVLAHSEVDRAGT